MEDMYIHFTSLHKWQMYQLVKLNSCNLELHSFEVQGANRTRVYVSVLVFKIKGNPRKLGGLIPQKYCIPISHIYEFYTKVSSFLKILESE